MYDQDSRNLKVTNMADLAFQIIEPICKVTAWSLCETWAHLFLNTVPAHWAVPKIYNIWYWNVSLSNTFLKFGISPSNYKGAILAWLLSELTCLIRDFIWYADISPYKQFVGRFPWKIKTKWLWHYQTILYLSIPTSPTQLHYLCS